MIVRSVLHRAEIEPFDWFNDYRDTLAWLRNLPPSQYHTERARKQALERLQAAYQAAHPHGETTHMNDPKQAFAIRTIRREEIATALNHTLDEGSTGERFTPDDPRLTDQVCQEYALALGRLDQNEFATDLNRRTLRALAQHQSDRSTMADLPHPGDPA